MCETLSENLSDNASEPLSEQLSGTLNEKPSETNHVEHVIVNGPRAEFFIFSSLGLK